MLSVPKSNRPAYVVEPARAAGLMVPSEYMYLMSCILRVYVYVYVAVALSVQSASKRRTSSVKTEVCSLFQLAPRKVERRSSRSAPVL